MGKSRDFVNDYDSIRSILRYVFLFGCFTVDDFEKKGISSSKYNQEKRKLLAFIDNKYIKTERINSKVAMHFTNDMFDTSYNFLLDTFMMKSFVDSEVKLYIKVIQLLNESKSELTIDAILEQIIDYDCEVERITLYRLLEKLVDWGYVYVADEIKPFSYGIKTDIFSSFSKDELLALMNAVDLLRNTVYPSVCGNFMFDTLNRYSKVQGCDKYENPFLIKHSHFGQVLDDEVMWELMFAITERRTISFSYLGKEAAEVLPIKIIVDEYYGRRYLFGVLYKASNRPCLFRFDKLHKLQVGDSVEVNLDEIKNVYKKQLQYSITGAALLYDRLPTNVVIKFRADMLDSVKKQFPGASLIETGENEYSAEIKVNDPVELKPWLRRFVGKIIVQKSQEHTLAEDIEAEIAEWRSLYEDIQ